MQCSSFIALCDFLGWCTRRYTLLTISVDGNFSSIFARFRWGNARNNETNWNLQEIKFFNEVMFRRSGSKDLTSKQHISEYIHTGRLFLRIRHECRLFHCFYSHGHAEVTLEARSCCWIRENRKYWIPYIRKKKKKRKGREQTSPKLVRGTVLNQFSLIRQSGRIGLN